MTPTWSGFIDLTASTVGSLETPGSSLANQNGAIFFVGSDVDLNSTFGWSGIINNQNASIHPISFDANSKIIDNTSGSADFSNVDVFEYYQFATTAYAVSLETGGDLFLYDTFQPWAGDNLSTAGIGKSLLTENVSSFSFTSMGDILIIQVCVSDGNVTGVGAYSVCKEKVVF